MSGLLLYLLSFVSFLQAGESEAFSGSKYMPEKPLFYYRYLAPHQFPLYNYQSVLEKAGMPNLSQAIDFAGCYGQTQSSGFGLTTFSASFGGMSSETEKALAAYVQPFFDWGCGNRLENTRKAFQSILSGEIALYAGGRPIQIFRADVKAWLEAVHEGATVQSVTRESGLVIEKIEDAQNTWFVATHQDTVFRSKSLELLKEVLARRQPGSSAISLFKTPVYRNFLKSEPLRDSEGAGFFDAAQIVDEFAAQFGEEFQSASLILRALSLGTESVSFSFRHSEPGASPAVHSSWNAKENSVIRAAFGSDSMAPEFFKGFPENAIYGMAWHLDLFKIWTALFATKTDSPIFNAWTEQMFFGLFDNLDASRFALVFPKEGGPVLALAVRDKGMLQNHLNMISTVVSTLTGNTVKPEKLRDIQWFEFGEIRIPFGKITPTLAVQGDRIWLGSSRSELQSVLSGADSLTASLDGLSKLPDPYKIDGDYLLADLSPLLQLFTGDIELFGSFYEFPQMHWGLQLGIRPQQWSRLTALCDTVRAQRPALDPIFSLDQFLQPAKQYGSATVRLAKGLEVAAIHQPDRLELESAFDAFSVFQTIANPKQQRASISDVLERRFQSPSGRKLRLRANFTGAVSFAFLMDLSPVYELLLQDSKAFRTFIYELGFGGSWPWMSVESQTALSVHPAQNRLDLIIESSVRPVILQTASMYLDQYIPSKEEQRVIASLLSIEAAETVYRNQGKYAGLDVLTAELGESAIFPFAVKKDPFPGSVVSSNYRIRLLLPESDEEKGKRWCAFATPASLGNPEAHLAFYIDDRGILFAALAPAPGFEMDLNLDTAKRVAEVFATPIYQLAQESQPPEYRRVYEHFVPYLAVYGGKLHQSTRSE